MQARPSVLGRHLLLDLQVSNSTLLNSIDALEVLLPPCSHTYALVHAFCVACFKRRCKHPRRQAALLRGAEAGNLTVLDKTFHAFSPHGITGMLVSYSGASQSRARFADLRASARKW